MPQAVRVRSLDVLRGAAMVLMAIDHVRVYSGQPAGGDTAGIFFTRWITLATTTVYGPDDGSLCSLCPLWFKLFG